MNTIKSILSICFLVSVGIVIGQTSVGRTLYSESVSLLKNNPINESVKSTVESAKNETKKVQKKIQVKYQEIKKEIKKDNQPKEALIVPKKYKGMDIVQSKVKGKTILIVADKEGMRCEYIQSPHSQYSRCYNKISSK